MWRRRSTISAVIWSREAVAGRSAWIMRIWYEQSFVMSIVNLLIQRNLASIQPATRPPPHPFTVFIQPRQTSGVHEYPKE
jgi:hypothetical protein